MDKTSCGSSGQMKTHQSTGKAKMATFERYFLDDADLKKEKKDYYYQWYENEAVINQILEEFGLDTSTGKIVNGHMPVAVKKGESPIKCGGKLFVIDGGFSKSISEDNRDRRLYLSV